MKRKLLFVLVFLSALLYSQNEFVTVWKPNDLNALVSSNNAIFFPGIGTNYNISWEEVGYPQHNGVMNNVTSTTNVYIDFGNPLNPDAVNATYRVKVSNGSGNFHRIKFSESFIDSSTGNYTTTYFGEIYKIRKIEQWGNIVWSSMNNAFAHCHNLQLTASDLPNLSQTTDLSSMFGGIINFSGNSTMMNWNVSNIVNFSDMFGMLTNNFQTPTGIFNINISGWDMSKAQNIEGMFHNQALFNQPIGSWNVANVTNMSRTFGGCSAFAQDITGWDTSSVTNMSHMFIQASNFNQPIGIWNTSSVIDMSRMFSNTSFNQQIGSWDTSNVANFSWMFSHAQFNQPIGNWDTSSATNFSYMFLNAPNFNQPIGSWNTSSATDTKFMFAGTTAFNQPLNSWNTSSVTDMRNMFMAAASFNQPLDNWNTSSVVFTPFMFYHASNFNQNLGNWNLSSLTSASNMFFNSGLNCTNWDSTLYGWNNLATTPNNINLGSVAPLQYNHPLAIAARNNLINSKNWTINGDFLNGECQSDMLSVSDVGAYRLISIYPVPANDFLHIKSPEKIKEIKIFDMSGKLVVQKIGNQNSISVSNLEEGTYLISIETTSTTINRKFIKK